jgi:hypothetical protein
MIVFRHWLDADTARTGPVFRVKKPIASVNDDHAVFTKPAGSYRVSPQKIGRRSCCGATGVMARWR